MKYNAYEYLSKIYCPRFGKIAVDMEFITPNQLKEALTEQKDDDLSYKPHRTVGKILLKRKWLTHKQIEIVLNALYRIESTYEKSSIKTKIPVFR
ncbi:MAG: hypothetical protein ACYSWS_00955 [Planctomycetota bacterium]|jgi:hypothetical protein